MDQFAYKDILQNIKLPFTDEKISLKWSHQQDNDLFTNNELNALIWLASAPNFNPIKIL